MKNAATGTTSATPEWLDARAAADALGVSLPTLYAYVSRGRIHAEPVPDAPRQRRYRRTDIDLLLRRREGHRDPGEVARRALDHGSPVLDSALTLIEGGHLYYRGRDVARLMSEASFEEVASQLWLGAVAPIVLPPPDRTALTFARRADLAPVEAMQLALPLLAARDPMAWDLQPAPLATVGSRILATLAALAGAADGDHPLATRLARGWGRPRSARLLSAALVATADHELNVSTFTARCVASAGATLYHAVLAGLCALQGVRHGGHTARVEAFCDEAKAAGAPARVVQARLKRGEELPGFGHPLYPGGDPRAQALLAELELDTWTHTLIKSVHESTGLRPTIDFALVALRRRLGFPDHAALTLFALGRTAGWVAHVIEQVGSPLIRPRARYTGPAPRIPGSTPVSTSGSP